MELVLNSKFFAQLSVQQLGQKVKALGYAGIDICVRPGHPITPDNVERTLPAACLIWADQGLSCRLATAPVNFNDATQPQAQALFDACGQAGIGAVKIGYWKYGEGDDYWQLVGQARRGLEQFARLAERSGVKACCHTHSGPCLGSNCAGAMHLVQGFDARHIGVYPDFGHLALDGEDLAMGLSMVSDYLAVVGIKDGFHARTDGGEGPLHQPLFVPVGKGSVDWPQALGLLVSRAFDGPLAVHTEYGFGEQIIRRVGYADAQPQDLEDGARSDASYLKKVLAQLL